MHFDTFAHLVYSGVQRHHKFSSLMILAFLAIWRRSTFHQLMKVLIFMILVTVSNISNFYWSYSAHFHMRLGHSKLVLYRCVFIELKHPLQTELHPLCSVLHGYMLFVLYRLSCILLIYQILKFCWISYDVKILSISFQDLLFLACSHPDNRTTMTSIAEWPEWILEVLISNHEVGVTCLLSYVSYENCVRVKHHILHFSFYFLFENS